MPPAEHGGPSGTDAGGPVRVDFSTSVNAYGPAPVVLAAARGAVEAAPLGAYPDPASVAARAALARLLGQPVDAIALGAGAAELILTIALAFVRAGDRVLLPAHAFGEYARAAVLCGAHAVAVPVAPGEDDASAFARAIARQRPRLVFLCTPESPSGRAWTRAAVREVADTCARAEALLVLDQSYDAFLAAPLGTPALAGHPSVLHLRSLTKDHGLAGLRVGYVVGPPSVVGAVELARMPWTVSSPAQAAVVAACTSEAERHVRETTRRLRGAAATLMDALSRMGVGAVPSDVHYFLVPVDDAARVARLLRARHAVRVRDCASFGLPRHLRVAARTTGENRLLLAALADVLDRRPPSPEVLR